MSHTFKKLLSTKASTIVVAIKNQPPVTINKNSSVEIDEEGVVTVTDLGVDFRDEKQVPYAKGNVIQAFYLADVIRITHATESLVISTS